VYGCFTAEEYESMRGASMNKFASTGRLTSESPKATLKWTWVRYTSITGTITIITR
jgi:hypothetical protein